MGTTRDISKRAKGLRSLLRNTSESRGGEMIYLVDGVRYSGGVIERNGGTNDGRVVLG